MRIGSLTLKSYGELRTKQSIDIIKDIMHPVLLSVCDNYNFKYDRFAFYAAFMVWEIPLKIFWKNDKIYSYLKSNLSKYFSNWKINVTLTINEKG